MADVWVGDHFGVPVGAPHPPSFLYEPVVSLTCLPLPRRRPSPDDARPRLRRLRAERPGPGFALSMRIDCDGIAGDLNRLRRDLVAFAAEDLEHVLSAPAQRTLDGWLRSVEALRSVFDEFEG